MMEAELEVGRGSVGRGSSGSRFFKIFVGHGSLKMTHMTHWNFFQKINVKKLCIKKLIIAS